MAYDKFLIGPYQSGWRKDLIQWQEPEDAFELLENALVFRGRIKKRFGTNLTSPIITGTQLQSRVRINVGTTDGAGNFGPTIMPGLFFQRGQMFSVGDTIFTVYQNGATLSTVVGQSANFDLGTGALTITTADANTDIYYYTALPILGIYQYQNGSYTSDPTFVCDTQFVYRYDNFTNSWVRFGINPPAFINNLPPLYANYFGATTWRAAVAAEPVFFLVNEETTLGIYYYNGTTNTWTNLNPVYNAAMDTIDTARLVFVFDNRLILLKTYESDGTHVSRVRYSAQISPIDASAWIEQSNPGYVGGGFTDCPNEEEIITAGFVKNRLIIECEKSTWELVITGNQTTPFRWQRLDSTLGALSLNSLIEMDKGVFTIGSAGIHGCDGYNVNRIDDAIPNESFTIKSDRSAFVRVYGIRDYKNQLLYWSYTSEDVDDDFSYPDKIFVYNYDNGAWAQYLDGITAFGYLELPDVTQNEFRRILAGNQLGFLFTLEDNKPDLAGAYQITNYENSIDPTIICVSHNLEEGDWIHIEEPGVFTAGFFDTSINYIVSEVIDDDTFVIEGKSTTVFPADGTYLGGATFARVPMIDIRSKEWNPYTKDATNVFIAHIDNHLLSTQYGEITMEYYSSSATTLDMLSAARTTGALLGTGILEMRPYTGITLETFQERLWHKVYLQSYGNFIQVRWVWSVPGDFSTVAEQDNAQMYDPDITSSAFEIDAIVLNTQRGGEYNG